MRVGKIYAGWDVSDVIKAQVDFLKEDAENAGKSDDELFAIASSDQDIVSMAWDDLCECLTELMARNKYGGWKAEVKGFGWQGLSGSKEFKAGNGAEMLRQILPETDCTFKVYRYGRGLAINNAHHDAPMWTEWYYVTPSKQAA